jgi:Rrf2 family protein
VGVGWLGTLGELRLNVSTKSEYGLRALIYLATHTGRGPVPAREISESWHVPVKYLEQILRTLREGGLVEGQVGVGGGYRLTRPAGSITAGEVIRLLDGRIAPMGCVSASEYVPCEFELKRLLARTREAMLTVLDGTTIADLCVPARAALSTIDSARVG